MCKKKPGESCRAGQDTKKHQNLGNKKMWLKIDFSDQRQGKVLMLTLAYTESMACYTGKLLASG